MRIHMVTFIVHQLKYILVRLQFLVAESYVSAGEGGGAGDDGGQPPGRPGPAPRGVHDPTLPDLVDGHL
jgi:hypothetical protein